MSDRPENPPAFPIPYTNVANGMSTRDYFAAAALKAWLNIEHHAESDFKRVARQSYTMADAMLTERAK